MALSLVAALMLVTRCAPTIAPETMLSVVQVESGLDPLAVSVNGKPRVAVSASTRAEAIAKSSALITAGRSVDLGLAQINSNNLGWLGLSVAAAFDPCQNLAAAARMLQAGYVRSDAGLVGEQPALRTALSFYNTGDPVRGLTNGYVTKVANAAARIVPAIQSTPETSSAPATTRQSPAWDVFGQTGRGASFVIRISTPSDGDPK